MKLESPLGISGDYFLRKRMEEYLRSINMDPSILCPNPNLPIFY